MGMNDVKQYSFADYTKAIDSVSKQYAIVEKEVAENLKSIFTKAATNDGDGNDQVYTADEHSWQTLIKAGLDVIKRIPNAMKNSLPNNITNNEDS